MKMFQIPKIDRNRGIPLYYQVSEVMEEMLKTGEILQNGRLMPEETLAKYFNVSRPTINKAISLLLRKSILHRERGKGTFIKGEEVRFKFMQEMASFYESMKQSNISFTTVVLALQEREAPLEIAECLELEPGARIFYLERLRFIEEEPVMLSEAYFPGELFPKLDQIDFSSDSLYQILKNKYNVPVTKTERYARAVKALEKEAALFQVQLGDPLIYLEENTFSENDLRIVHLNTKLRGDKSVLCSTLYRQR
jgi:DNA-binding GntR family transcriptional regulator